MHKQLANNGLLGATVLSALLILFVGSFMPAHAADDSLDRLFNIQAVKVDETAVSAAEARKIAFSKAELLAYDKLLRKLTQPEGRERLPQLGELQLQSLISGIEVVDEQSSSRRYVATLNVRFEPSRVSAFFAQYQVPHVLGTGGGILVLHAHARGLSQLLWEQDPVLQKARASVDWLNRIRHYVFPYGAVSERLAVSYEEVNAFNSNAAKKMTDMYGVQAALMIASSWEQGAGGGLLHYRFYSTDGEFSGEGDIAGAGDEATAIATMYDRVLDENDSAWRQQLLVDTAQGGEMSVLIATESLAALNGIENKLKAVALVQDYQIESISLPVSRLHFRYSGREDQLVMALRYAGLTLRPYGTQRMLELRGED
ncbi:MAG: DUF2066 domain-containing protein [Alphaproteobacteria bacterium]|nr:MAG: DUF2066 domain-containing protein [Alphaproteobacteria bacterium]